jgi:hypothetical protein
VALTAAITRAVESAALVRQVYEATGTVAQRAEFDVEL